MKQKKWMSCRLLAGGLVTLSLTAAALAASQGSQSDPLVTLSYLNDKAIPAILSQVDTKIAQRETDLKSQLQQVADGYAQSVKGNGGSTSAVYQVVSLSKGQTLTAGSSCEILLRTGTGTCSSSTSPGLVDMTGGSTLAPGGTLTSNHLYLATQPDRGVRAVTAVTLMVRGSYSIQ
ncbi:hypothetical protein [Pseudoflavonifractor sp. MSJ-37]|uniref:hypothetical protein n=1 Tax=Pseudoflavonifractor sp. MSJ-37 TaxID=2841531 RepID=UPI001C12489E|nr:hypothetical protein [Pseudoflavonifractor sp. MSJ-37]MBU5434706.1 hypothetical protein [Pseudoflavonifractor sp. MSJ-37]